VIKRFGYFNPLCIGFLREGLLIPLSSVLLLIISMFTSHGFNVEIIDKPVVVKITLSF